MGLGHRILPSFTHPFLPVGLQGPEPDTPAGGRNTGSRTLTPPPPDMNPRKKLRGNQEARLPEDLGYFLSMSRAGKAREESEVTQPPGVGGRRGDTGGGCPIAGTRSPSFPHHRLGNADGIRIRKLVKVT